MPYLTIVIAALVAYLFGSLNASIIISNMKGSDIRKHGSGNAGATNMLRTYGKKLAVLALLFDALKGVVAVLVANWFLAHAGLDANNDLYHYTRCAAGLFVVLGHNFPLYFKFKGGKGIATSAAVIFMLDWRVGLIVFVSAIGTMIITRYVSLGSCVGAVAFPTGVALFTFLIDKDYNWILFVTSLIMCFLAIGRHHTNIKRLINGTESKLGKKKEA